MKRIFWIIYVCGIVAVFQACTTVNTVSFERLQAAEVNFPEQIMTVGVVNCAPYGGNDKDSMDYSSGLLEGDGKITAEVLAQELAAANYFNQIVICDSALHMAAADEKQSLSIEKKDSLIRSLGVDMLLAVEHVQIQLKEGSFFHPDFLVEVPGMNGMITPLIRAYIPSRSTPLFSFCMTDTICWQLMPDLTYGQIIKEASEYAAQLPINYLLPHWEEMSRFYFDGGNVNMRDAGFYVREQDWENAYLLWKELYDTKKGKVKMRAAYNMAVYYELQDDFVHAKECLDTAVTLAAEDSWEMQLIQYYQLQLEEQAKLNQRLKVQMRRFDP